MKYLKKLVLFSVIAVPLGLPFMYDGFRELGEVGWKILIGIMVIRPLADIFPDFKFLRKLVSLRKEFGILSAVLILSHAYGYFLQNELNIITEISKPSYWDYADNLLWGTIGAVIALLLLITSNMIAIRILKKWWKPIQRLSYLFFLLGAIHIGIVEQDFFEMVPVVSIVFTLWILAEMKIKIRLSNLMNKNNNQ